MAYLPDQALRLFFAVLILGICGIAVLQLPMARGDYARQSLMMAILDFETPRRESVVTTLDRAERTTGPDACHPSGSLAPVVLRVWLAEEALRVGDLAVVDSAFQRAREAAERALHCDVANPFALIALLRLSILQNGPSGQALALLRLSHKLAPREAWLIIRRAHASMMLRSFFANDDEARLLEDVSALVESGLMREAIGLARMMDAPLQRKLNRRLAALPAPTQLVYQRAARRYVIDLDGLTIPPPLDTFR